MMRRVAVLTMASLLGVAGLSSASDFDGEHALICSFESASQCDTDAQCSTVNIGEIELPESIGVDFKGSRLRSPDGARTSPIDAMAVSNAVLVAQGNQNGRGWSMAIDRATGRMTGAITDTEGTFVLTGSCANAP
jgi:hypothetical protein